MQRDVLDAVLAGRVWQRDVEAIAESTGAVVAVLHADGSAAATQCPVCLVAPPSDHAGSSPCLECFSAHGLPGVDEALTSCRGGMPAVLLRLGGPEDTRIMVSGFVTSEAERRVLLGRLLAEGLPEKQARAVARATPVLRRDAALALVRLVSSHLEVLLASHGTEDERGLEYELLYEIRRGFDDSLDSYDRLPALMAGHAARLTSAEVTALYVLEGDMLEALAHPGEETLLPSGTVSVDDPLIGHACRTGRSILVCGFGDESRRTRTSSLAVPLRSEGRVFAVLALATTSSGSPLSGADLQLMELYAETAGPALANARRYADASSRVLELMQLNELSRALNADAEIDRVTYLVTSVLDKVLEFEVGGLLLTGREEPARIVMCADVPEGDLQELLCEVTGMELPQRFLERCAVVQNEGTILPGEAADPAPKWSLLVRDISTSRPNGGYLFVASRDPLAFDERDERLLGEQAAHASVALEKARTYARLRGDLDKLVKTLSAMADAAERTTQGHAGRVMTYAVAVGEQMEMSVEQLEELRFAALLHDIGKLGVSEEIILKPSRLTDEEMAEVRRHAEIGAHIIDQMDFLDAVVPIVMHHHERWDGKGYPKGLSGEDIPLAARILAIADAFDAMTIERAYSKALPRATACVELRQQAGKQFDPAVVEAFLAVLERWDDAAMLGLLADSEADGPRLPA
ncbi:MAG TPA: HD domain-containing phosphohydrolase [Coriobacteriia bacterium]|jgi:putative nucleotidyltransferase with HDIG domain